MLLQIKKPRRARCDISVSISHRARSFVDTQEVEWRTIPGTYGHYACTRDGRIKRTKGGKGARLGCELKRKRHSHGYCSVMLSIHGKQTQHLWHRLIAKTWIGPAPKRLQVNHKDGNKRNNHCDNLEYVTCSQNNQHAIDVLHAKRRSGDEHFSSKLTDNQCREIIRRVRSGESRGSLAALLNMSQAQISRICSGQSRAHLQP